MSTTQEESDSEAVFSVPRYRLWHLFALVAWVGVAITILRLFDSPFGVFMFIGGTVFVVAIAVRATTIAVAVCIVACVALVLSSEGPGSREAGPRAQCLNNLKQITLALQNYEASHGAFPPAYIADANGKPMHSWRVLILPHLDRNDLYKAYRFDEPWDGPNNSKLHAEDLSVFYCPSDVRGPDDRHTSYVAVVGDHTVWPGAKSVGSRAISDRDGADRTILLVETNNSGIHWMEPRDTTLDLCVAGIDGPAAGRNAGTKRNHAPGDIIAFADGHVEPFDSDMTAELLKELLTIDDDAPSAPNWPQDSDN